MHIMLDLETMGTRSNAMIVQIGAVLFEPVSRGKILNDKGFNMFVEPDPAYGTVTPSTLVWWLQQPGAKALGRALEGAVPLTNALDAFQAWPMEARGIDWANIGGIWSNGATFDQPILTNAFGLFGMEQPWPFRTSRDCRTLFDLIGGPPKVDWTGLRAHDAFDDAVGQAMQVQAAMHKLKG